MCWENRDHKLNWFLEYFSYEGSALIHQFGIFFL